MAKHSAKFQWKKFGQHVRDFREGTKCSLRETAEVMPIGHATLSRAENGKPVTVPVFLFLCDWMNSNPFQYQWKSK
jgi:transcriptional regulator with XRE-family HTH domain